MRRLVPIILIAVLAGCDSPGIAGSGSPPAVAANEFPKAGKYHIIRDITAGAEVRRYETDNPVDASSRDKLLGLLSGSLDSPFCDDRQVTLQGGSFSIRQNCGSMAVDVHGTYSTDSIDIARERTVDGTTHVDTETYRLNKAEG